MTEYTTREQKTTFYKSNSWRGKNGLRQQALVRDKYECVKCREKGQVTTKDHATLEVDHILEIETHPDKATDLDNLQTLCRHHHNQKHNRFMGTKREDEWQDERW